MACRALFFPDDVLWLALVAGALLPLTYAYNFEQFGTATPPETADEFRQMFDSFSFNQGVCRVIGEIITLAGSTNPNPGNWLPCDGASLLRASYPDLFAAIGVVYGSADGTHFTLPDLRGRVSLGIGTGAGLSAYALGDIGGEETHTLITSETPAHSHIDTGHTHSEIVATPNLTTIGVGAPEPTAIPGVGVTGIGSASLSSTGGNGAHNNLQPFIALNYFIVALP
jgi:microcystin-dependent protein